MRIYVAAHFYDYSLVRDWYARLRAEGHTITYPWAEIDGGRKTPESELTDDVLRAAGERDLKGVYDCQLLLFLAHNPEMLGAPWEGGYAYRRGCQIIVVAPYRRCPFFLQPGVQVMTEQQAIDELTGNRGDDVPGLRVA